VIGVPAGVAITLWPVAGLASVRRHQAVIVGGLLILSLTACGKPSSMPPPEMVQNVRSLVEQCRLTTNEVVVVGKVFVWDLRGNSLSGAQELLPADLQAKPTDTPVTIVLIVGDRKEKIGTYSVTKQPAFRQVVDLAVVYWPHPAVAGQHSVQSVDPPARRRLTGTPGYGDPSQRIADWIMSRPIQAARPVVTFPLRQSTVETATNLPPITVAELNQHQIARQVPRWVPPSPPSRGTTESSPSPPTRPVLSRTHRRTYWGSAESLWLQGRSYLVETSSTRSVAVAMEQLEQAALQGLAVAQNDLAVLYDAGEAGAEDVATAREWWTRATAQAHPAALVNLGSLYEQGRGGVTNLPEAARLYEMSAERGDAWGQFAFGRLLLRGDGGTQDWLKAVLWLSKSAAQGHSPAIKILEVERARRSAMTEIAGDLVTLRSGEMIIGQIIHETPSNVTVQIANPSRTIMRTKSIPRDEVDSILHESPEQQEQRLAYDQLLRHQLDWNQETTAGACAAALVAHERFLTSYPRSSYAVDVIERLVAWHSERDNISKGLVKFSGRWMTKLEKERLLQRGKTTLAQTQRERLKREIAAMEQRVLATEKRLANSRETFYQLSSTDRSRLGSATADSQRRVMKNQIAALEQDFNSYRRQLSEMQNELWRQPVTESAADFQDNNIETQSSSQQRPAPLYRKALLKGTDL
jgi:hypothetical protein